MILEVQYFQHDGSKKLELLWAGPGVHYSQVTKSNLSFAHVPLLRGQMVAACRSIVRAP